MRTPVFGHTGVNSLSISEQSTVRAGLLSHVIGTSENENEVFQRESKLTPSSLSESTIAIIQIKMPHCTHSDFARGHIFSLYFSIQLSLGPFSS